MMRLLRWVMAPLLLAWVALLAVVALVNAVAWVSLLQHFDQVLDGRLLVAWVVLHLWAGAWLAVCLAAKWTRKVALTRCCAPKGWLPLGVAALLIAVAFYRPILERVDDPLLWDEPPQVSDLIWVLGNWPERSATAVDLYQQGWAPQLVFSLDLHLAPLWYREEGLQTNLDAIRRYALRRGVPAGAMQFVQAENTFDEALQAKRLVEVGTVRSILVVSSPTHMRRVRMIFSHVLPKDVRLTFSAVPLERSDFTAQWWTDPYSLGRVIYEYASIPYYFVRYMLL